MAPQPKRCVLGSERHVPVCVSASATQLDSRRKPGPTRGDRLKDSKDGLGYRCSKVLIDPILSSPTIDGITSVELCGNKSQMAHRLSYWVARTLSSPKAMG